MKLVFCPHVVAHVKDTTMAEKFSVLCAECGPRTWTPTKGVVDDPWADPGWLEYAAHVQKELIPMIDQSAITMSLVPDAPNKIDVKYATELGYCIILDKPILAMVTPGVEVPPKLKMIADEIIEGGPGDPGFEQRFTAAMDRMKDNITKKEREKDGNQDQ